VFEDLKTGYIIAKSKTMHMLYPEMISQTPNQFEVKYIIQQHATQKVTRLVNSIPFWYCGMNL